MRMGLPGSSAGKESVCKAGDPCLIPGLGRSPEEGIGYPLQYSGLENPMDCSPWDRKESDTTARLSLHSRKQMINVILFLVISIHLYLNLETHSVSLLTLI